MFEGFKPTAKEKKAIEGAWNWLISNTRDEYRSANYMKGEQKGYNRHNDRVPLVAAKGMCLQWFLAGVQAPELLLRDCYYMRPATIWFEGMGAGRVGAGAINMPTLNAAVEAYKAAFGRMIARDKEGLSK